MNEMTTMAEPTPLRAQSKRLRNFLQTAVAQFQIGDDAAGIENLLAAAAELENLVEADRNSQRPQIDLRRLLPAVRKLHFYIQNQDIAGISDLLEDTFCPLTEEWLKGCGST